MARLAPKLRDAFTRRIKKLRLLIFAGVISACWGCQPRPVVLSPPEPFPTLKQRLAVIRGLPFKRDVSLDSDWSRKSENVIERIIEEEYGGQSLLHLSYAYKRLGLLPESTDFVKALIAYDRLQRIAFYDSRREIIGVGPEAEKIAGALAAADVSNSRDVPLSLAIIQALQGQHFHWHERLSTIAIEDRKLAFRALAHGDAIIAALTLHPPQTQAAKRPEQLQSVGRFTVELEKMAASLPRLLREKLVFPYREGSHFVLWAQSSKGWDGVNALFAAPPLSTSQILHPEKYFVEREEPLRIVSWGLGLRMKESAVIEQTLGEFLIGLLLTPSHSRTDAAAIASGWRGDQLSVFYEGEQALTTWISVWRGEQEAMAFYRGFQMSLQQRRRRFEPLQVQRGSPVKAELLADPSTLLQLQGSYVLWIDGLPPAKAAALAEDIWRDLETLPESTVIPFDAASRNPQWSLRRR